MKNSTVLKLVPVLIIAMIGISGWFVLETNKTTNKANQDEVKLTETTMQKMESTIYKDTAGKFTLQYPKTWTVKSEFGGGEGPIPDPAVTSRPVQFIPANAPDNNSVTVNLSNDTASFTNFEKNMKAEKHTVKTTKINGYEAKYTNYTYKGDAEGYTNHMYVLEKNNTFVTIIFRSGYNHDNVTPSVKWDDSKDMNGFMQIVKSVKFL